MDGNRLSGRDALAIKTRLQRRPRHLRLSQGRLLFLSESVDADAGASSLSALELGRPRGSVDHSLLLHELRDSRIVSEQQEPGNEGLYLPEARYGETMADIPAPCESVADHRRPASFMGCALRTGNTKGRGKQQRRSDFDLRSAHNTRSVFAPSHSG